MENYLSGSGGMKCSGTKAGSYMQKVLQAGSSSLGNERIAQVSWLQVAAEKMQVWERASVLLDETWGTSGQGGELPEHPVCRAGAANSSEWDDAEKDCRVNHGKWESVLQEESQSAQPA